MMNKKKMGLLAAVLLSIFLAIAFATTMTMLTWTRTITVAPPPSAVVYIVTKNLPGDMYQDTTYDMIITAENKAPIPYNVSTYMKVVGPVGFNGRDILVNWVTWNQTDSTPCLVRNVTIGRDGTAPFEEHEGYWVDSIGFPEPMNPGEKYEHHVFVTLYGSGPTGTYTPYIRVDGTGM